MSHLKIPVNSHDHSQGAAAAKVTLVEYGDYQCPYCGAACPLVKRLQCLLGDELQLVFRNFPLAEMHPQALAAAMTAEFAATHGQFWQAHDALYENQARLGPKFYEYLLGRLGLSVQDFQAALQAGTYVEQIRADFNGGVRSGVNGTPTFFINGQRYDGPLEFDALAEALNGAVAGAKRIK